MLNIISPRQKNNFFRIPATAETAKSWVIEEIESEMMGDPDCGEVHPSLSVETPALPSSASYNSLEQIRKKMRLEKQQEVRTCSLLLSLLYFNFVWTVI